MTRMALTSAKYDIAQYKPCELKIEIVNFNIKLPF